MNNDRRKVIKKIAAALRLSESTNPHEAAIALRQAKALMDKYSISECEVDTATIGESVTTAGTASTPARWLSKLAEVIASAYGVEYFLVRRMGQQNQYTFIGPDPVPQVASYAFTVLRRQLVQARSSFYKTRRGKRINRIARADAFAYGWVLSVSEIVGKFAQPLKVQQAINHYMEIHHSNLIECKHRKISGKAGDLSSIVDGILAGQKASLVNGVSSNKRQMLSAG